jgi:hypothetical protein
MTDQARLFEAGPDPFGRMWKAQFRWLQIGISIRHADTMDVKYWLTPVGGGETEEKVIALPHPLLLKLTRERGEKLTDPYCMRLAAAHIRHMIETLEDMEKTIITVKEEELMSYDAQLHEPKQPVRV